MLNGKLLLGWMTQQEAVTALREASFFKPQLTVDEAISLWSSYRARVLSLPQRPTSISEELAFDDAEKSVADNFMTEATNRGAANIVGIIKVLPADLLVHQTHLVTSISAKYEGTANDSSSWASCCLGRGMLAGKVPINQSGNKIIAQLPHAEYRAAFGPGGRISIIESEKMIGVVRVGQSLWLSSGYHRAYAALQATNTPILAAEVTHPKIPDLIQSGSGPRLLDYLDETLTKDVWVWPVRYELHIDLDTKQSRVVRLRPPLMA